MAERSSALGDFVARAAAGAREDARRIARELLARGDVRPEEAEALEQGVAEAVEAGRRVVETRLLQPLSELAAGLLRELRGGARDDTRVLARLEALDARLARVERRLAREDEGAGD